MTGSKAFPEQLPTGIAGLDRLLHGGIRRDGMHVVLGRAGAGKSILAHQAGAHHIRQGGTVLYLTALVETHQTLVTQARAFSFFDASTKKCRRWSTTSFTCEASSCTRTSDD